MKRNRCNKSSDPMQLFNFVFVLLLACGFHVCLVKATTVSHLPVKDWIVRVKCNSNQCRPQLWKYQGALYDPLDGRRIARVEGLEWVGVWNTTDSSDNHTKGELLIDSLLQQQLYNTTSYSKEDALTLISQKVFCYTTETGSLLQEIRVRPNSPLKKIPLDQAVSLFETATTYISSGNDDLLVHSEWPSGQSLWGKAAVKQLDDERFEWTVYTKRRSKRSPMYLPDLIIPKPQKTAGENAAVVVSPKRSALIQFGNSNMEESKHRFGARETYSWTLPAPKVAPRQWWKPRKVSPPQKFEDIPRLQYTRYGEGPPFYAPNRMCMLELQAVPIDNVQEATEAVRQLLNQNKVHGWGCYTSNSSNDKSTLFRDESKLRLILPEPRTWAQRKQQKAMTLWERVRAASSLQPN